jgi:peptidoglycan/xylan/chitin deacetylase (PgdA/CDA1 family)
MNISLRRLVEISGYIINPLILKLLNENGHMLSFFFHGIYRTQEEKDMSHIDPQQNMTVKQFSDFIQYFLESGYKFVGPDDLLNGLSENQRYVLLTFDDGYFNNTLAIEVLNKYQVPAVFFVTARNILENKSFWWDVVYKYRKKQGLKREKIRKEQNNLKQFDFGYIENYLLKTFGTDSLKPWSDIDRPLTEQEIKSLVNHPFVHFGNHTFNHTILVNAGRDEIRSELIDSNRWLTELTGKDQYLFAFPNGDFNKLAMEVAEEVGFRYAFTAIPKKNKLPLENRKLIYINRFMSNHNGTRYYGSFYRIGYSPGALYSNFIGFFKPSGRDKEH